MLDMILFLATTTKHLLALEYSGTTSALSGNLLKFTRTHCTSAAARAPKTNWAYASEYMQKVEIPGFVSLQPDTVTP